jgi:hypothetical protein
MEMRILDLQGRVLESHSLGSRTPGLHIVPLRLSHLANGTYLVQLQANGRSISQRVVKFER